MFGVQGLRVGVYAFGFRFGGSGIGSVLRLWGLRLWGLRIKIQSVGFRVQC